MGGTFPHWRIHPRWPTSRTTNRAGHRLPGLHAGGTRGYVLDLGSGNGPPFRPWSATQACPGACVCVRCTNRGTAGIHSRNRASGKRIRYRSCFFRRCSAFGRAMSKVLEDLRVSRAPSRHSCVTAWAQECQRVHQDCVVVAAADPADGCGSRELTGRFVSPPQWTCLQIFGQPEVVAHCPVFLPLHVREEMSREVLLGLGHHRPVWEAT